MKNKDPNAIPGPTTGYRKSRKMDADPLDLNWRLYKQLGRLLDDMEAADRDDTMTFPQRISAMIAVGRVQKMFQDLRKGDFSVGAGTAIDKYAAAFAATDATGGRKPNTGSASDAFEFDSPEPGDPDYSDAA